MNTIAIYPNKTTSLQQLAEKERKKERNTHTHTQLQQLLLFQVPKHGGSDKRENNCQSQCL
jgi:hypothetical protein